ncbi:MAG: hypothetical protein UR39_C0010G0026 [Candidatus Woesebacteria bacterium GW2011_GWA1_33_30]|nr:MAG: hypothetical protein UR39_C0010G0026 [Candidatus Woesebacteria bacterium GW2011_GWA1_33_30]
MTLTDHEKAKLLELGVDALILFGSQAQNNANINSDYDFYVIGTKSILISFLILMRQWNLKII